jgi:hypothetical protein
MFEIQSHTQLVAQAIESGNGNIVCRFAREFGAVRAEVWGVGPATVTARGVFNLDHFGAKARQNERGERPGEGDRQIEDSDSIKGFVQAYFSR